MGILLSIYNILRTMIPFIVVINHFTDSYLINGIAVIIIAAISAAFPVFGGTLGLIAAIAGFWFIFTDGYSILGMVIYTAFVLPSFIVIFKGIASKKEQD